MNKRPIEEAKYRDIRLSQVAPQRAALRARDLAASTGTSYVLSRDGVIEYVTPKLAGANKPVY